MTWRDLLVTIVTFCITSLVVWRGSRSSQHGYIRWQWKKPWWPLGRLAVLFSALHFLFAGLGISALIGYTAIGAVLLLSFGGLPFSPLILIPVGFGAILREWVFWFPSRRELILRHPRPARKRQVEDMAGKIGIAQSDLKPTGYVVVESVEYPARSDLGFIAKGERVSVHAKGDFELIVKQLDP